MRHIALFLVLMSGCAPSSSPEIRTTAPVASPSELGYHRSIDASALPPLGWRAQPLKTTSASTHIVWVSPTGRTAYGIIHFVLPLPVGHELALWGFMENMKRHEGDATLLGKEWDEQQHMLRFVAEGGKYRIRANIVVRGLQGWAAYAGTLRAEPVDEEELKLAEAAREESQFGE